MSDLDLSQFTGTTCWYQHALNPNISYTEGVQYLAQNAHAYWLIDEIALNQHYFRGQKFQVWTMIVHSDSSATLHVEDGDHTQLWEKNIPYTDFQQPSITLWCVNSTILLPSEY